MQTSTAGYRKTLTEIDADQGILITIHMKRKKSQIIANPFSR